MYYNKSLGMIYDTIKFFDIFFNYDEVKQEIITNQIDINEGLKYYNNIKKFNKNFSPQIHAFFAFNGNNISFLMNLFFDNISTIDTVNTLIKLLDNENLIVTRLINYYFYETTTNENILNNNDKYINKLYESDFESNLKISINSILINYKYIKIKLIDSILNIYTYIEKLQR